MIMRITNIEPVLAGGRYLFVKVHTDEGLTGLGECGAWAYQEATAGVLKQMEKMIMGMDPMRTEFIWNALSRNLHFRGSGIRNSSDTFTVTGIRPLKIASRWAVCFQALLYDTVSAVNAQTCLNYHEAFQLSLSQK